MAGKNDRVYDELLSFLGDPMFQIPVRTFLDENCLIFDPAIDPEDDHKILHGKYKRLIDALLDSFCRDMNITVEEAIAGINKMVAVPDLKEVFNVLFDQVMAATDFKIFCQLMIKRNIMIQEQVLVMIIAATGGLPASLLGPEDRAAAHKAQKEMAINHSNFDQQEEDVLKQVMATNQSSVAPSNKDNRFNSHPPLETKQRSSKKDAEAADHQQQKESQQLAKTLELSKHEAAHLSQERQKMETSMKAMALGDAPPLAPILSSGGVTKRPPPAVKLQEKVQLPPSMTVNEKPVSGADAADQWLASAHADAAQSSTHSAIAASLSKLSPGELKQRQDYLREQRDKLLAMKKEAREKQLGDEASSKPQRPQSARTARAAMSGDVKASEDEKKLAMRRAIAAKLKEEVIGNKY